jgi:hypothetical protein
MPFGLAEIFTQGRSEILAHNGANRGTLGAKVTEISQLSGDKP